MDQFEASSSTKHIFVRDRYKQWYLHGINENLNSVEKLCAFLKKEIGKSVVDFIGSSAGGYAVTFLGSMLHVDLTYNFNGHIFLHDLLCDTDLKTNLIIFREKE